MRKKEIIVMICALLIIIVGVVMVILNQKPIEEKETYNDLVNKIIKQIDNKETFNLYLYSPNDESDLKSDLDYYENVFSIKFEMLEMRFNNETFKELVKKLDIDLVNSDEHAFFVIIDGSIKSSINGLFSENQLRNILIKTKRIGAEYKDIDYLVNDEEFDSYYSKNEEYYVLYINGNKDLYKYREILAKNKVKSLVIYEGRLDSSVSAEKLETELGLVDKIPEKYPMLIKIKNHKILSSKFNVTLDDLKEEISSK